MGGAAKPAGGAPLLAAAARRRLGGGGEGGPTGFFYPPWLLFVQTHVMALYRHVSTLFFEHLGQRAFPHSLGELARSSNAQ
jgi:hypothetical protein